jgi:single-stranded DNA-binding protein
LRALRSGDDVARLRVATSTLRRTGEEWVDKTNCSTVEVYGAQAGSCAQYLSKDSHVVVDAELDWREWTGPEDKKREAVTLRARQVLFEGGRPVPAEPPTPATNRTARAWTRRRPPTASRWASRPRGRSGRRAPTICRSDPRRRMITRRRRRHQARRLDRAGQLKDTVRCQKPRSFQVCALAIW